jgi:glycosyltransferase involved in cell wall biosynthesis
MTSSEEARPRRVLQTLPDLQVGGGQVIALSAIRHLPRSRYHFEQLALDPDVEQMVPDFRALGVEPVLIDHKRGHTAREVGAIATFIRERHIDVVHVHGADERRLVMPAALAAGVPVVCHLHSEWVHLGIHPPPFATLPGRARAQVMGRARDWVEHRATRLYLADSAAAADRFRPHVRSPILTMTQSMPFDLMDRARSAHDERAWRAALGLGPGPVAINVSRAVPGKGQDRLIRAFGAVVEQVPGAQLVLVGDGELRGEHQRLARELGVADAVRFLGTRRDIPDLLVGADLFVFASHTESFGLVVGEAMTAQLPVLAYRLPSLDTFSRADVTGYYPAQQDEATFIRRFCELLADGARRRRMGQAGFELVAERFPVDATARSFDAAYRWVLEEAPVARRFRLPKPRSVGGPGADDEAWMWPVTPQSFGMRDRGVDAVGPCDPMGAVPVDHVLLPGVERGGDHRTDGGGGPGGR